MMPIDMDFLCTDPTCWRPLREHGPNGECPEQKPSPHDGHAINMATSTSPNTTAIDKSVEAGTVTTVSGYRTTKRYPKS